MHLQELLEATSGELIGKPFEFDSICIDSRRLKKEQLFVAIKGEQFDGHDFCQQAIEAGAVGCLVDKKMDISACNQIIVQDTTKALADIAECHLKQFNLKIAAITGSCGKTTVKEMVASILAENGKVYASRGNFNNHIGLPLSLLELNDTYQYGVFELGANHVGEIDMLCKRLQPDVSVITTVAPAHIEGFGSIENVARAKSEIYGSVKKGGVCIAEVDSPYLQRWQQLRDDVTWLTFGIQAKADVSASHLEHLESGCYQFMLNSPLGSCEITLPILGQHNVKNALAAAAVAIALDVPLTAIKAGLSSMRNVGGRLEVKSLANGAVIIDDTYNANPASVFAAIDALQAYKQQRFLVLGDMAELGPKAADYHRDVGTYAKAQGIERIFAIGHFSESILEGYGHEGVRATSKEALVKQLQEELGQHTVCLVKGSRSAKMEEIVRGLLSNDIKN